MKSSNILPNSSPSTSRQHRGIVTVMVIVVLMLMSGLILAFVQRALSDRRQVRLELEYRQAVQVAMAGVQRARVQRSNNRDYDGEVWTIPAGRIHQTNSAEVTIRVSGSQAEVIARYPAEQDIPFQVTRKVLLLP